MVVNLSRPAAWQLHLADDGCMQPFDRRCVDLPRSRDVCACALYCCKLLGVFSAGCVCIQMYISVFTPGCVCVVLRRQSVLGLPASGVYVSCKQAAVSVSWTGHECTLMVSHDVCHAYLLAGLLVPGWLAGLHWSSGVQLYRVGRCLLCEIACGVSACAAAHTYREALVGVRLGWPVYV